MKPTYALTTNKLSAEWIMILTMNYHKAGGLYTYMTKARFNCTAMACVRLSHSDVCV